MRNKIRVIMYKSGMAAVMLAVYTLLLGIVAFAAPTVSVTADKENVQVSDTVTVCVKTSEPEDASQPPQIQVFYDPNVLEYLSCDVDCGGGGGQLSLSSTSASLQFKALAQGTSSVSVEANLTEDGNSPVTASTGISVGTMQQTNLSSDATLRALSVNPGVMSPSFSPTVTEYTITVEEHVTDITVSGGVTDEKAQITAATGFKNLKEDENQAIITVTAEDGTSITYHFLIVRGAALPNEEQAVQEETKQQEPQTKPAGNVTPGATTAGAGVGGFTGKAVNFVKDGITYQISQGFDTSLLPQGGLKAEVTVQGQKVQGVTFEKVPLTVVYAISGSTGKGDFFICDESQEQYYLFVQIPMAGSGYVIPVATQAKAPDGFAAVQMQWDDGYVPAYQIEDGAQAAAKEFYLFYAVNEKGEYGYYLYDAVMGTCQRYVALFSSASAAGVGKKATLTIGILLMLVVVLLLLVCNQVLRNRKLADELSLMKQKEDKPTTKKGKKVVMKENVSMGEELSSRQENSKANKQDTAGKKVIAPKKVQTESEELLAQQREEEKRLAKERHAREQKERVERIRQQEHMQDDDSLQMQETVQPQDAQEENDNLADAINIQITGEKKYVEPSAEEIEKQKALEQAKEEKKKAARKAALEREIQKDEKARAKQAAAEKKAMEKLLAAEQKLAARQAAREEGEGKQPALREGAKSNQIKSQPRKVPGAKIQPADPQQIKMLQEISNTARMRTIVKKEVTDRGVTYTTGKIPVEMLGDKGGSEISNQVPIFTLEKRTVSLTRESAPDELDDDFEYEFLKPDSDS